MLFEERILCLFVCLNMTSSIRIPAWCIVKIGQLIGASFEMKGLENINVKAGAVVVINHQSAIDLIGELSLSILKTHVQPSRLLQTVSSSFHC